MRKGYLLVGQSKEVIWYSTDLIQYKEGFSKNWAAVMGTNLGIGDGSNTAGINIWQILSRKFKLPMGYELDDLYHPSNLEILWLIYEITLLTLFILMTGKGEIQKNRA